MKRKLLICCSLITLLLSVFSVPIYAETDPEDIEELVQVDLPDYALDSYFYDNYYLLPYIESSGSQVINTGINGSNNLKTNILFSNLVKNESVPFPYLFGVSEENKSYSLAYDFDNTRSNFYFGYGTYRSTLLNIDLYLLQNITFDRNNVYLNGSLINTFSSEISFESSGPIYLFARNRLNAGANLGNSSFRLYRFSIYDYDQDEYVRFYYPAKSKSGAIGLYDSITKTFSVSSATAFSNPTDDYVLNFQISDFLTSSITWIGQIFTAIIDMPIIIVFMAIGLAGAMFRWGRRIVHF